MSLQTVVFRVQALGTSGFGNFNFQQDGSYGIYNWHMWTNLIEQTDTIYTASTTFTKDFCPVPKTSTPHFEHYWPAYIFSQSINICIFLLSICWLFTQSPYIHPNDWFLVFWQNDWLVLLESTVRSTGFVCFAHWTRRSCLGGRGGH